MGEYDQAQWTQVHKDALAELLSIREELAAAEADIIQLEELDSLVRTKPGAGDKAAPRVGPPPKPGAPKKVVDELMKRLAHATADAVPYLLLAAACAVTLARLRPDSVPP